MLSFLLGRAGAGKSAFITERITQDLQQGRKVLLLVPEQQALMAENAVNAACVRAGVPMFDLEVLNFTRLANRVFRQYGGLSYHYATSGARAVMMWLTLCRLSGQLKVYGQVSPQDAGMLSVLVSACTNLKRYRVTPDMLMEAADRLEHEGGEDRLCGKMHDLALIAAEYNRCLHERYDDPGDDLTKLDRLLDTHPFFAGKQVYLDSFFGFTPDQMAILHHIMETAENVILAFPVPEAQGRGVFGAVEDTLRRLRRLAAQSRTELGPDIVLEGDHRHTNERLQCMERYYWDTSVQHAVMAGEDDALTVYAARTLYEECDAMAADIARRVRAGARYRDFVVVARDAARYDGIAQISFEKYNIPYFFAVHRPLDNQPLVRMILAALCVFGRGWRCEDVLSYLKTGLTSVNEEDADLLEEYAVTWRIRGSAWYADEVWCMSPDGYSDAALNEEQGEKLRRLEQIRQELIGPLRQFESALHEGFTLREGCEAVYAFLRDSGVWERMEGTQLQEGEEAAQIWNAVMDSLDILTDTAGETVVTVGVLSQLLTLVFGTCDLGRIPSSMDQVTVGGAATVRPGAARHIYLLGLNEGVFPAPPVRNGLFDDRDLSVMESLGVELAPREEMNAAAEQYHVYRALCAAPDGVHLSYALSSPDGTAQRPSAPIDRLRTLFPDLTVRTASDTDPAEFALTAESSLELAARYRHTPFGASLEDALRQTGHERQLQAMREPLSQKRERISPDQAQALFGDRMILTQSRIDRYVRCPMSYYGPYVLRLRERKSDRFTPSDLGNFMHRVLEVVLRDITREGRIHTPVSEEEIAMRVHAAADAYFTAAVPSGAYRTPRMRRLFSRMSRTACMLIRDILEEFVQSDFAPVGFELRLRTDGGEGISPLRIPLEDGSAALVTGIIDRLDACRTERGTYVRVVDYKTGGKDFSLKEIEQGHDLQMLLYLYSAIECADPILRRAMGASPDEVLHPAGVLYFDAGAPVATVSETDSDSDMRQKVRAAMARRGLTLADPEILHAMNHQGDPHYTAARITASGAIDSRSKVMEEDGFAQLHDTVTQKVAEIATQMRCGVADAAPAKDTKDPCRFCVMRPVCRNFKKGEDDDHA